MSSIKPIIPLFLFFACGIHSQAQLTPDHVASPNAASLGRFGDIPVSYYTGRAAVSIPLYKTTQRGVELDISLHYDTSGLLMNSLPGWTGNGWTLNAGGVITRCVNIRNDEYVFPPHVQNQMICPAYNYFQSYSSLSTLLQNPNNDYRQLKDSLSNCVNDYAPDVFYFNFMGKSGRFMLGNDGQWKVYCDENIDVMFNINDEDNYIRPFVRYYHNNMGYCQPKTIKGFTIVDDHGNRYIFGGQEEDDTDAIEYTVPLFRTGNTENIVPWTADAWYLKRVEDRIGNILYSFEYERGPFIVQFHYAQNYSRINAHGSYGPLGFGVSIPSSNQSFPFTATLNSPVYLKNINIHDGYRIDFVQETANAIPSSQVYQSLYSHYANAANLKHKLTNMAEAYGTTASHRDSAFYYLQSYDSQCSTYQIQPNDKDNDPLSSAGMKLLKAIKIKNNSSYFQAFYLRYETTGRVHLKEVDIYNKAVNYNMESGLVGTYKLTYHGYENIPSDYLTTAVDHWGYYNGYNNGQGYNIFNSIISYDNFHTKRQPSAIACKYGMLTEIRYPTGGKSVLEYEPNDFSVCMSDDRQTPIDTTGISGGVRIKSITEYEDSTNANKLKKRSFSYNRPDGNSGSSGILFSKPRYYWKNWKARPVDSGTGVSNEIFCTTSIVPLSNDFGPHTGYSYVTETREDGSRTVYHFSNTDDSKDSCFVLTFMYDGPTPYDRFCERGFRRGKLLSETIYDSCSVKQQVTNYYYRNDTVEKNYVLTSNLDFHEGPGYASAGYFTGGVYKCYYPKYDVVRQSRSTRHGAVMVRDSVVYEKKDYTVSLQNQFGLNMNYPHNADIRLCLSETTSRVTDSTKRQLAYPLNDSRLLNQFFLQPISVNQYINGVCQQRDSTVFKTFQSRVIMPHMELRYYGDGNVVDTLVTYQQYSGSGRLLKYQEKGNSPVRLFWNDNDRLETEVSTSHSLGSVVPDPNTEDPLNRLKLFGRSIFSYMNASAKIYQYNADGLLYSITSGNGDTEYYLYDYYGRLAEIQNGRKKTIRKFKYKYKTGNTNQ